MVYGLFAQSHEIIFIFFHLFLHLQIVRGMKKCCCSFFFFLIGRNIGLAGVGQKTWIFFSNRYESIGTPATAGCCPSKNHFSQNEQKKPNQRPNERRIVHSKKKLRKKTQERTLSMFPIFFFLLLLLKCWLLFTCNPFLICLSSIFL